VRRAMPSGSASSTRSIRTSCCRNVNASAAPTLRGARTSRNWPISQPDAGVDVGAPASLESVGTTVPSTSAIAQAKLTVMQGPRGLGVDEATVLRWEERGLLRAVRLPRGVRPIRAQDAAAIPPHSFTGFPPATEEEPSSLRGIRAIEE
jgi:hypothetical protein